MTWKKMMQERFGPQRARWYGKPRPKTERPERLTVTKVNPEAGVITISGVREWIPAQQEEQMRLAKTKRQKIVKEIKWRSADGKWAVVPGPFPDLFPRSETRDTVDKAARQHADDVVSRHETTKDTQYAKVYAADILEVKGGKNEFGPITP